MGEAEIIAFLSSEKDALHVQSAILKVDRKPGLYSIFVDDATSLPDPFRSLLVSGGNRLLYIGRARDSLYQRLIEEELRHKKAATFFRGIGALLGFSPPSGSLREKKNKKNYKFSTADSAKIIAWNEQHLLVRWLALEAEQVVQVEAVVIHALRPLMNTIHNPNCRPELAALRAECRRVACL